MYIITSSLFILLIIPYLKLLSAATEREGEEENCVRREENSVEEAKVKRGKDLFTAIVFALFPVLFTGAIILALLPKTERKRMSQIDGRVVFESNLLKFNF